MGERALGGDAHRGPSARSVALKESPSPLEPILPIGTIFTVDIIKVTLANGLISVIRLEAHGTIDLSCPYFGYQDLHESVRGCSTNCLLRTEKDEILVFSYI